MFAIQLWIKKKKNRASIKKKKLLGKNVYLFRWPKSVLLMNTEYICQRG